MSQVDGNVDDDVAIQLGLRKKYDENYAKKYSSNIERLEKNKIDIKEFSDILHEDEDSSKRAATKATAKEIAREIELLIGKRKEWSSENEEVKLFRENMNLARTFVAPKDTSLVLPPVYVTHNDDQASLPETFICNIHLAQLEMTKLVKCKGSMTANEFADEFITKINQKHKFKRNPDDWIFKATGKAEYLYGNHKMIDFDHIRNCLKKGTQPNLTLMLKEEVLKETDQTSALLGNISYDIGYTKESNYIYNHDAIKFSANSWDKMECISQWDLEKPFRVKLKGVDNITVTEAFEKAFKEPDADVNLLYVVAQCYHGGQAICEPVYSKPVPYSRFPRFNQWLEFPDLMIADMPREVRMCFTLYCKDWTKNDDLNQPTKPGKNDFPVAWVNWQLIDHKGVLKSGSYSLGMWPDEKAKPTSSCAENLGIFSHPPKIQIEFESYSLPVVDPTLGTPTERMYKEFQQYELDMAKKYPDVEDPEIVQKEIDRLVQTDPLYEMNEREKWIIWKSRNSLVDIPKALPKFLQSVNWKSPCCVRIAHSMLKEWKPLPALEALELLDWYYADAKVRQYAVQQLETVPDAQLSDFLLQLVQALKFESYHDSALARFLLQRAIRSTHMIGHLLFWHLKAEMHIPEIRERYGLILEEYLQTCIGHRRQLLKQVGVIDQLLSVALLIKKTKKSDQEAVLKEQLNSLILPPKFTLPLSPKMEVKGIITEKCKVMDSKKLPLWLCFENADPKGSPIYVIFKAGDDLRQDLLTLQMLRIMDKLWKDKGLDLHLQPYGCVSTGDGVGMIEVVLNADTIANITAKRGGFKAAFTVDPLYCWLKEHNPNEQDWGRVVENFVYSCAGYCSATYVLGIGDRHNDNIMLSKFGDLFHIDFGHFLGHFKKFAGVKRETTPFVFTPMYAHVMGGEDSEDFMKFQKLAAQAFNIIREKSMFIITLFCLMLACGLPELSSTDDIMFLRDRLRLDLNDNEATEYFYSLVKKSLNNYRARFNDALHILAHQKPKPKKK